MHIIMSVGKTAKIVHPAFCPYDPPYIDVLKTHVHRVHPLFRTLFAQCPVFPGY